MKYKINSAKYINILVMNLWFFILPHSPDGITFSKTIKPQNINHVKSGIEINQIKIWTGLHSFQTYKYPRHIFILHIKKNFNHRYICTILITLTNSFQHTPRILDIYLNNIRNLYDSILACDQFSASTISRQ